MLSRIECRFRDFEMRRCRDNNRDRINVCEKGFLVGITTNSQLLRDLIRTLITRLDESCELDRFHVAQNPDVMKSKTAGADDADFNGLCQMTTPRPLASTKRMSSLTSGYISSSVSALCIACDTFRSERKNNLYARFSSRTTSSLNPLL